MKQRAEVNSVEASTAGNMACASTTISQESALEWVKRDKRRLLHVVYRVGDLEKTIKYLPFFLVGFCFKYAFWGIWLLTASGPCLHLNNAGSTLNAWE